MSASRQTLPAFAPVPRKRNRHDGWTPDRQRDFIEKLADYGSVRAAANAVGMAPEGAYYLRRQPGGAEFAKAWEAALDLGIKKVEDVAMDRALNGVDVPVYSYGKLVGTRTVHNDRLLMFMLRNRAPGRFAEGQAKALNAIDKAELARLKKQWRKEWEEERRKESGTDEEEVIQSINKKFGRMREEWLRSMSPRTRAAHDEYRRLEEEDKANGYNWLIDPEHPASPAYKRREREEAGLPPLPRPAAQYHTIIDYAAERAKELQEEEEDDESQPEQSAAAKHAEPRIRTPKDDRW